MAKKKYCSPTGRTAAAAAAPARLVEEYGDYGLWRDRPDGALEVATLRDGWLYRHLVHDDGTSSVIDYEAHKPRRPWATPLAYIGFGFCALTLLVMVAEKLSFGSGFFLFLGGMAVMGIGVVVNEQDMDVANRLNRRPETAGEWHEPSRLSGWAPDTSAQLAAVEQLADEHNGLARVRDTGGEAVEVFVWHWARRRRYIVHASGRFERATPTSVDNGAAWREVRTMEENSD